MEERVALIGFGEAAQAFAQGWSADAVAYDRKLDDPELEQAKRAEAARAAMPLSPTNAAAVGNADLVIALVTADQALAAARQTAAAIRPGALYLDMNSVAPQTKRAAAAAIVEAGGCYVDVAVMAPVHPPRRAVPLLVAGPDADAAADALRRLGFTAVAVAGDAIGDASAIKMIRSVMVKGMEALSAECVLAAEAAGVREAVIASLDAGGPGGGWARRFDCALDRMMVHGLRRAAEMEEVVATLETLGTGATMSRGTVVRQRAIGALGLDAAEGLDAKLAALSRAQEDR